MPCFRPLKAYKKPGGGISFSSVSGWVDGMLELPCGKCIGCRIRRTGFWAVRIVHEAQMHQKTCFITLTYDNKHLPKDGGLDVSHWQYFAKRMRKRLGPFRFFHCGEYGDQFKRPHYHAVVFGQDFSKDRRHVATISNGDKIYRSGVLDELWGKGKTELGAVNYTTAAYVASYCLKKVDGKKAEEEGTYERVDPETGLVSIVRPEYITMSRRPGIGTSWYEKFKGDIYPSGECVIDGKKMPTPRFYDQKFEKEDPVAFKRVVAKRIKFAKAHEYDGTFERLMVREQVMRAQQEERRRELE